MHPPKSAPMFVVGPESAGANPGPIPATGKVRECIDEERELS